MNVETIRNFTVTNSSTEDLVAMLAFGRMIQEEYDNLDIDGPDWLAAKLKQIRRKALDNHADAIEHKAANLRLQLEGLKTTTEKRKELEAQLAKLEKVQSAR